MKKYIITFMVIFCYSLIVLSFVSYGCIKANYEYENKIYYAWSLADKSSTLSEKSKYINEFIENIKKEQFAPNDALFFPTKDNSFEYNLKALESLNYRLKEISKMDETTLAYQTAIQQITSQEQGEAYKMLSVIQKCWYYKNYFYLWDYIGFTLFFIHIMLLFVAFFTSGLLKFLSED